MTHRLSQRNFQVPSFEYRLMPVSFYQSMPVNAQANTAASVTTTTAVVGDSSANTKGLWTDLIASTSADATELVLFLPNAVGVSNTNSSTLLDIGTGGSGQSGVTTVIPNIEIGGSARGVILRFPISIPAGTRVCARLQSAITSKSVDVCVTLRRLPNNVMPATYVTTYGADTSTSKGTAVPYSGTLNTKNSPWIEITSGITERAGGLVVGVSHNADASMGDAGVLLDIGTGGSGVEVVLEPDLYVFATAAETVQMFQSGVVIPCDLPAGTRIAARCQVSVATTNGVDITVHAIPWRI